MYSIVLANGKTINVKADVVEWYEKERIIILRNEEQTVARINIDNVAGWIDTDCMAESEDEEHIDEEPCEDVVDRQTVKEQMTKYGFHSPDMTVTEFVEDLPPANPQPKTAHWIKIKPYPLQVHDYKCSSCGNETDDPTEKYCNECGAKILGVIEEEE